MPGNPENLNHLVGNDGDRTRWVRGGHFDSVLRASIPTHEEAQTEILELFAYYAQINVLGYYTGKLLFFGTVLFKNPAQSV